MQKERISLITVVLKRDMITLAGALYDLCADAIAANPTRP